MSLTLKRVLAIITACALSAFALSACGGNKNSTSDCPASAPDYSVSDSVGSASDGGSDSAASDEHVHSYGAWEVVKDATCTEEGEKQRFCACGDVQTRTIDKLAHQYGADGKCVFCGADNPDYGSETVTLTAFNGASVDVCNETIRSYIDNRLNPDTLAGMLWAEHITPAVLSKQDIVFSFAPGKKSVAPYTVSFADNAEFTNAFECQTTATVIADVGYFIPGLTYYWKVTDKNGIVSQTDTFTVKNQPVRWITAGTMKNVRDCGGWTTESGKVIPYGLLFRGDGPENADEATKKVFNHLGIKGEIDLRIGSDVKQNFLDASYPFLNGGINYFYQIVPGEYDYSTAVTDAIGDIFEFLADTDNYPVYFHCSWGKDRTGTLAFIVGGLLGVKFEDLMCDYELSSYGSGIDSQPRNAIVADGNGGYKFTPAADDPWGAVGRLEFVLRRQYATSNSQPLSEVVATYLKSACGVTDAEIASVRSIFLS